LCAADARGYRINCFEAVGGIQIDLFLGEGDTKGNAAFKVETDWLSESYGGRDFIFSKAFVESTGSRVLLFAGPRMNLSVDLTELEDLPNVYNATISVDVPKIWKPSEEYLDEGILCYIAP
jgi:hypothetical protein